jgi:hypothetical protein
MRCVFCETGTGFLPIAYNTSRIHGPYHGSDPSSIPAQSAWDLWQMKWHWDRVFSHCSCFLCQYRSANAPYTPPSTVALTRTNGCSLGTFKSNAVWVIRTRFSRLLWTNTSAVGTTSCYLTPTNPNVDVSWLTFLFRIWWLSCNLTVAKLSPGHSRWCLHHVTDV